MRLIPAFLIVVLTMSAAPRANAVYMITNFAASQAPVAADGGGTLTHLPGSAEVQADESAGFENAFNFFVTRGFAGSLAEQFVNHDTIEFDRRNIPDPSVNTFLNTFFVINTDAGPIGGYTVIGAPQFLDPNNPVMDDFVFSYGAHPNAVASLQNYNNGAGTFMVIHIVQQSDGSTSVAYGDLSLTGNPLVPEPTGVAIAMPVALIGAFACRRRRT